MKPTKFKLLFALLLLPILLILTAYVGGRDRDRELEGGWEPIEDPTGDPRAKEMAEFAVSENNQGSARSSLKFEKVISGETQPVAGWNYRLVILASSDVGGGSGRRYEAVVYWRPWERYKSLTSFRPV